MTGGDPVRHSPLPTAVETDACFIVRDHNGQALAYVYFEDEPGRQTTAKLLSKDEARRIAANIQASRVAAQTVAECPPSGEADIEQTSQIGRS